MSDSRDCCDGDCCSEPVALSRGTISGTPTASGGEAIREEVRDRYAAAARRAAGGKSPTCGCGTTCCGGESEVVDPITMDLYTAGETAGIPAEALMASLGCGNPTALAALSPGETVLDLGSGGGIDVLLSARRVGPTGKAYGLDMTDEMLELARENQRRSGLDNAEFLRGEIENIPLPARTVDVIISNCVINLSADKPRVFREAHRVLKPGGRLAVSDILLRGHLPDPVRRSVALWTGCVAGALHEDEYRTELTAAGFTDISIEPTRVYAADDIRSLLEAAGLPDEGLVSATDGKVFSAFVRAVKA